MTIKDHFLSGFIPGIVLPFIGSFLFYLAFFSYMQLDAFYSHLIRSNLFVSVLSVGVILNLLAFFYYYRKEMDRAARGVIGATFLYAFMVVYFKVL